MREDIKDIREDIDRMRRQMRNRATTIYNNCQNGTNEDTH